MNKAGNSNMCKGHCASGIPLFNNLDCTELLEVVKAIGSKKVIKGDVIFKEGSISNSLCFINEGKVKLYKYTKDGKEQILSILSKNDFVGDLELLRESTHKFNAEAIEDCKLCIITKDEMKTLMMNNPEMGIKILESVAEKLSQMEELIQNLATNDIDARVAYLLIELIEKYGDRKEDKIIIELSITREDMANYIGVTRETMSRKLRKFEDDGIIQLDGMKRIIVLDEEKLTLIS